MITDKERREVSAELRALDVSYIGVNGRIIDSPKDAGLLLIRMLDVVFAHHDKLHYFPGFISARSVVELFADLIDRPTCLLELTDVETHGNAKVRIYECSECGRTCEEIYGKYERCPHCGAVTVDAEH